MRCCSGDTEGQGRRGDTAGRVGVNELSLAYLVGGQAFVKRANPRRWNPGVLQDSLPFCCRLLRQLGLDLGHQFAGMRLARRTFGKARIGQPVLAAQRPAVRKWDPRSPRARRPLAAGETARPGERLLARLPRRCGSLPVFR